MAEILNNIIVNGSQISTPKGPEAKLVPAPAPEGGGKYWRQLDFIDPEKLNEYAILVAGAGSVGSWATLALAKMGAQRVTVWDRDIVDLHNASVQIFSSREVGGRKALLLSAWVDRLADNGARVTAVTRHLDADAGVASIDQEILVMAVDSMPARRYLWDLAKASPKVRLVIDVRMGGEVLRMYAVDPRDPSQEAFYEGNFYDGGPGEALSCSAQATIYTSMFAAAFVSSVVSSFVSGQPLENEVVFHTRTLKIIRGRA
jgi:molybdopterin/thiamine biosynthesis adenylyltransferase